MKGDWVVKVNRKPHMNWAMMYTCTYICIYMYGMVWYGMLWMDVCMQATLYVWSVGIYVCMSVCMYACMRAHIWCLVFSREYHICADVLT